MIHPLSGEFTGFNASAAIALFASYLIHLLLETLSHGLASNR
jgi:hypothetical protein